MSCKEREKVRLGDVVLFNPTERLAQGTVAKKVTMDKLQPFTRGIGDYDTTPYAGGAKFRNGDTLMARITPCLENGKTAWVSMLDTDEVGFGSTEYIVLRNREGFTDSKFVYYFSINPWFRGIAIKSMVGSSGRQRVQQSVLENLEVSIPPLPTQRRIARISGLLDDKIELNRRLNDNLEQQAQVIFKSWFVDSAMGQWELKPLSFYGDIICGKTPSKAIEGYFGGDIPFIKIPDMHGRISVLTTEDSLTKSGKESQNNKTLPSKSILVSCIATVGLVVMNAFESQCNQQINAIIPKHDSYRHFLFLQMKCMSEKLHILAGGGTATLNLNTGNFSKIELPCPDQSALTNFDTIVSPLFEQIYKNQAENLALIRLRDTLLPKLMSGELSVEEV